jgi:hypothetical protein
MDNVATTALTETRKVAETSIEESKMVTARAEDTYRAWYSFVPFSLFISKTTV